MKRMIVGGSKGASNLMSRLKDFLSKSLKDAFTSNEPPKVQKVKDPDTDLVGTLYTYKCANPEATLNVELYDFPGSNSAFIVRCYISGKNGPIQSTIEVLNSASSSGYKPILQSSLSKKIKEYVEEWSDIVGDVEDDVDEDINTMDGFEQSQYEDDDITSTTDQE